jgi:hypothetical protein
MLGALLLNLPVVRGVRTTPPVSPPMCWVRPHGIANLFSIVTRDVTKSDDQAAARSPPSQVIAASDHLVAGWSVSGLGGPAA